MAAFLLAKESYLCCVVFLSKQYKKDRNWLSPLLPRIPTVTAQKTVFWLSPIMRLKAVKKAQETLQMIGEAGMTAYLYHEAGYQMKAEKVGIETELAAAQAKLAYCSIDDNCPKAVFKLRDNKKVRLVYQDWCNIGWLVERKRMVEQVDYLLTPDGSNNLEFKAGQIHVKPDLHQETRLITHGARLAVTGQSDLFIG